MRYAIFADIHSNLEAYEAVFGAFKKEGELKYFCVGDIVGYGADPTQCIEITKSLKPIIVCGNHDWAAVGLTDIEYFNPYAKEAVLWTRKALTMDDKEYLKSLDLVYQDNEITMVHGTLSKPEEFDYILDAYSAYKMLEMTKTKITFIGHSHVPGIFSLEEGRPQYHGKSTVTIKPNNKYLINVGSIGQPRDRDWRSAFCIYDKDKALLEIRRTEYDIRRAQKKILESGLPEILAYRLQDGT